MIDSYIVIILIIIAIPVLGNIYFRHIFVYLFNKENFDSENILLIEEECIYDYFGNKQSNETIFDKCVNISREKNDKEKLELKKIASYLIGSIQINLILDKFLISFFASFFIAIYFAVQFSQLTFVLELFIFFITFIVLTIFFINFKFLAPILSSIPLISIFISYVISIFNYLLKGYWESFSIFETLYFFGFFRPYSGNIFYIETNFIGFNNIINSFMSWYMFSPLLLPCLLTSVIMFVLTLVVLSKFNQQDKIILYKQKYDRFNKKKY